MRILIPIAIRTDTVGAQAYISARIAHGATMPKWKKDATEFTVGVSNSEGKGVQTRLPKPVFDVLDKPGRITFRIRGKRVEVEKAKT